MKKRRYPDGTILRNTSKAIRRHPNHFSCNDRYRVTGPQTAEWFKSEPWTDRFSGRTFAAGEIIQRDTRVVHDSFVEPV